jgi:transcription elongation factor Elf1
MPTFAVSLSRYSLLHQTLRIPPTSRAERPPPTSIMGKRKKSSRGPVGPKRKDPLPSTFTCLFCNHENSVIVKLDKKAGVGQLDCRLCGQQFQCAINYLSAPVDVYGEWVDAAGMRSLVVSSLDSTDTIYKMPWPRGAVGSPATLARVERFQAGASLPKLQTTMTKTRGDTKVTTSLPMTTTMMMSIDPSMAHP